MPCATDTAFSPVYSYLNRPSLIDFPGKMAAVFFTAGCNFRCGFCHNHAQLAHPRPGLPWEHLALACSGFRENWVDGAVISGGEPTLAPDLPTLVGTLRNHGFAVKLDTNGSHPDRLAPLLRKLAYVAMDIKCGLAGYADFVGYHAVDNVSRSVGMLMTSAADYEFRTTVLESVHSQAEVERMGQLVEGAKRFVIQPFLPRPDLPDAALRTVPRTRPQHLRKVESWLKPFVGEVIVRGA